MLKKCTCYLTLVLTILGGCTPQGEKNEKQRLPTKVSYGDSKTLEIYKSPLFKFSRIIPDLEVIHKYNEGGMEGYKAKFYLIDSLFEDIQEYHDLKYENHFSFSLEGSNKEIKFNQIHPDTAVLNLSREKIIEENIETVTFSILAHFENEQKVGYDTTFTRTIKIRD